MPGPCHYRRHRPRSPKCYIIRNGAPATLLRLGIGDVAVQSTQGVPGAPGGRQAPHAGGHPGPAARWGARRRGARRPWARRRRRAWCAVYAPPRGRRARAGRGRQRGRPWFHFESMLMLSAAALPVRLSPQLRPTRSRASTTCVRRTVLPVARLTHSCHLPVRCLPLPARSLHHQPIHL